MKSNQEALANIFSSAITGAPYIFFTDEYTKGNATREPADLAWCVNDSVILIFMKESKFYEEAEKRKSKTEYIHKKNLDQAKGWIRTWRQGRNLLGRNEYNEFDIPYSDSLNIIILSVYKTGELNVKIDTEFTKANNISLCAMLPEEALELMAASQFSPIDIINVLKAIYNMQSDNHNVSTLSIIQQYKELHMNDFNLENDVIPPDFLGEILRVQLRGKIPLHVDTYKKDLDQVLQLFNDLSLYEYIFFAKNLKHYILEKTKDNRLYTAFKCDFRYYDINVIICNFGSDMTGSLKKIENLRVDKSKNEVTFLYMRYQETWVPMILLDCPAGNQLGILSKSFFSS